MSIPSISWDELVPPPKPKPIEIVTVGKSILDIGCGTGNDLLRYPYAVRRVGIDVDLKMIDRNRIFNPGLEFYVCSAESLLFTTAEFDIVMSYVALPYTDLPLSLKEAARVLKPGGILSLHMHDWRHQLGWFWKAIRTLAWKRALDHGYIAYASLVYAFWGHVPVRPWNGLRETFQTRARLEKELRKVGFKNVQMERTDRHFIVKAIRM